MQEVLMAIAAQIILGDELASLYALRAQQTAGNYIGQHKRDEHNRSWDTEMMFRYECELQEKISTAHTKFKNNQTKLLKLISELEKVPA